jgi:nicotinamidase/pyrazinamidase
MPNAILVCTMVREFAEEGNPYFVPATRDIIPNLQRLIEAELARGSTLFFCNDWHTEGDLEWERMFPRHCAAGTPQAETIPELARYPGEMIPITRYDGFLYSKLEQKLHEVRPDTVIVCGVCTHIPVLHTAAGAAMRDYRVEVPTDCVADFDPDMHAFALRQMKEVFGIRLTTSHEHAGVAEAAPR